MKRITICFLGLIAIILCLEVKVYAANEDYESFNEVMMAEGKLLRDFTQAEYQEYYKKVSPVLKGLGVYVANYNVYTSYISETLYNIENRGSSNVSYEFDVTIESVKKTGLKLSANFNGSTKGDILKFKTELSLKAGIEYDEVNTLSKKEIQKLKVTIDSNSRAIVYVLGTARVTNGVVINYLYYCKLENCGFEFFTILNQYPRMEQRKI